MRTIICKLLSCLLLSLVCVSITAQQTEPPADEQAPIPTTAVPDTSTAPRLVVKLGHADPIALCVLSADGARLLSVASSDPVVILWDVATGAELRRFVGHDKEVSSIAFSPDGRTLVTSSRTSQCVFGTQPPARN
jgi:WD40 repeat protein